MVLETFSVSHGKAGAYLPLIELLSNYFGINNEDDERRRREKVAGRLAILDPALENTRPHIFALLGIADSSDPHHQWEQNLDRLDVYLQQLQEQDSPAPMDPRIQRRRTLDAIKRVLLRESLNQPLIVIFEDLHWIDEATQEFLNLLADSIGTARILLLVNYRPEYSHQWGSKTYYTQLRLDPLGKEGADEMLSALLGANAELDPLKRLIIERTEGNPFFMEEMVQVLLDKGALVQNGTLELTRPLAELKIPPTVQAILASRIDRLPSDAKDLLQTLAVIGREFRFSLICAVLAKPDDELNRLLNDLQLGEFIYEQPAVGDTEYIFKHALTQEVAYGSVLMERRRTLHAQIAATLESSHPESIEEHLAELAHHYARSANAAKAVEYCLRACKQSSERASYAEAIAQFETGLARLQELPDNARRAELELDLRNTVHTALVTTKGYSSPEGEKSAARALELAQRPGVSWEKSWVALRGLLDAAQTRPDTSRACALAAQRLALAEQNGNVGQIAQSVSALAFANMCTGDFHTAAEGFDRATALFEPMGETRASRREQHLFNHEENRVRSAWNLWHLGYPDRARKRADFAIALARESNFKSVAEMVHNYALNIFFLRREVEPTRENAEATVALATELGNPFRLAIGEFHLGWVDAMVGAHAAGVARMRRALAELRAIGSNAISDQFLAAIATALGQMAQFDEALGALDEAFSVIVKGGSRRHEAEIHRLRGELLLAQDSSNAARAEESFLTAIEISRGQKAKSWELRATTSFARLLMTQGHRDEARAMLADIYNWFTEGFDTADLKDAKALLEEIS